VAHHPLAELTRSSLRTVTFDWLHDDWFAALKAVFRQWTRPKLTGFENEALARGWHGAEWRESLQIPENAELEKFLERLHEKILPPFQKFCRAARALEQQAKRQQLAGALREFWSEMKVEPTLERWSLAGPGPSHQPPATRHFT